MRGLAARNSALICFDAVWLAVEPLDMRAGMGSALARVVKGFGGAHSYTAYLFAICSPQFSGLAAAMPGERFEPIRTQALVSPSSVQNSRVELLQTRLQPIPGRYAYAKPQRDDENGTDSTGWLRALRLHPVVRLDAAFCKDFGWQQLDG